MVPARRNPAVAGRAAAVSVAVAAVMALVGCTTDEPTLLEPVAGSGNDATVTVDRTVARLNRYWSTADQELGFDYRPVPADRISSGDDGVTCNGVAVTVAEVEQNAFVDANCEEGILVAYDADYLAVGSARIESTLSHEWGHVVQAQAEDLDLGLDRDGLPIDSELQADCFSGAWAADDANTSRERLSAELGTVGDEGDVAIDDEDAHGTAGERLLAFDVGFDGGPQACIDDLIDALPG